MSWLVSVPTDLQNSWDGDEMDGDGDARWVYTFYATLCNLIRNNTCTVTFDKTSPYQPKSIVSNILIGQYSDSVSVIG